MIQQRLQALREVMRREHLSAFIFPSTDPHNSEYVADYWKSREWISGFNGSAGTAVVTMTAAALWTDSRYFLAAEEQLRGTSFVLMKEKIKGTPTIAEWLGQELKEEHGAEVGIDGQVCSVNEVRQLIADLRRQGGITLRTNLDPLTRIWADRPALPDHPVVIHPLEYAGEAASDKMARIRRGMLEKHADGLLMSALDDIAWTLNLRGSDVHCHPVFVSYLLMTMHDAVLYIDARKLSGEVQDYLKQLGVRVADYKQVKEGLKRYLEYNILMDPNEMNYTLYSQVKRPIVEDVLPVKTMKIVKNEAEIAGFRRAMVRDGVALVKLLRWLQENVPQGKVTEMSVDSKLTALRAEQDLFRGLSFDTIAGYQEHGAIVHYAATPETDVVLQPEGFLLLDSGTQYQDGTTDVTRTIALGKLTEEQKRIYTLVLKGHIQLQLLKFPDGAAGTQLDAIARRDLWKAGLNFLHGTGHGVGSYLSAHEGPHQIRMEWKPTRLHKGMTITDEPGIYVDGQFGVRIENLLLVTDYLETAYGKFLQFETLTLCPIDRTPILTHLLTQEEIDWLNHYHQYVYEQLAPYLNEEEKTWLRRETTEILQ